MNMDPCLGKLLVLFGVLIVAGIVFAIWEKEKSMSLIEKELRPVDLIFPERQAAFKEARCMPKPIGCGEKIGKFKDPLSEKEYGISGLCEKCQEEVFGTSEE
jgi:hypothetical protein